MPRCLDRINTIFNLLNLSWIKKKCLFLRNIEPLRSTCTIALIRVVPDAFWFDKSYLKFINSCIDMYSLHSRELNILGRKTASWVQINIAI